MPDLGPSLACGGQGVAEQRFCVGLVLRWDRGSELCPALGGCAMTAANRRAGLIWTRPDLCWAPAFSERYSRLVVVCLGHLSLASRCRFSKRMSFPMPVMATSVDAAFLLGGITEEICNPSAFGYLLRVKT